MNKEVAASPCVSLSRFTRQIRSFTEGLKAPSLRAAMAEALIAKGDGVVTRASAAIDSRNVTFSPDEYSDFVATANEFNRLAVETITNEQKKRH